MVSKRSSSSGLCAVSGKLSALRVEEMLPSLPVSDSVNFTSLGPRTSCLLALVVCLANAPLVAARAERRTDVKSILVRCSGWRCRRFFAVADVA